MTGAIIDAALGRSRAVILILLAVIIMGAVSYKNISREYAPDVKIPIIYVSMNHEGISPEDAERLLVRPMEVELRSIEGIKEMRSTASQGFASVLLEFTAGFDSEKALLDVREKVDLAKPELPEETDEPIVNEVNFSLFPVINVILTGNVPERTLIRLARDLRDKVEGISSVLNVDIAGDREEQVDIVLDPLLLESYGLTAEIVDNVTQNNILVAAGVLDSGTGRYAIKVPGLLEGLDDILDLPVKQNGDAIVTVADIAQVQKTFKDPEGFARVNGKPAVALEVAKRTGENIIETIQKVRAVVEQERKFWPEEVNIIYSQDQSQRIIEMLVDLQNNILLAMLLVMVVVIAIIGVRSAMFIALAIPSSFLMGILVLHGLDLTLNIVVLFSLILSIGMLVDSAIVVTEYADRRMMDGMKHTQAYGTAAKRMSWPIIASTVTTLAVFMPLLFWPGVVGQFMMYMPITLIMVLTASMLMALIFLPTVGTWLGKQGSFDAEAIARIRQAEEGDINTVPGFTGSYIALLNSALNKAGRFVLVIFAVLMAVYVAYGALGVGVEFFPEVEPDNAQVQIRARGNLSVHEKDALMAEVEDRILDMRDEVRVFYARSGSFDQGGKEMGEDVIGVIQMEFGDWNKRRKAKVIQDDIRERTADMAGIVIETAEEEKGPPTGKPVQVELTSRFPELLAPAAEKLITAMEQIGELEDIEDNRPLPGIEWQMEVNREQAARFDVSVAAVGQFIKLVTTGLLASTYRPDDSDDEVDIMIRFPKHARGISQLDRLSVITEEGAVPISNFVERKAEPKVSRIDRVDGFQVMRIKANVEEGILPDKKVKEILEWMKRGELDPRIQVNFKGEDEEQKEASNFLTGAFILALFVMALVMVIQFNSIYHMVIIMSAVFLSTVGVLLGLIITQQPFGIVMCGVGIISLAGIVVNNNIIFIDTYREMRDKGMDVRESLLRTGAQRLRPILLTAGTTVLGLIPMVMALNIDFVAREVTLGAPSTQWWRQLSTTIAGGLAFATILTLFFTPCLIALGERWFGRKSEVEETL